MTSYIGPNLRLLLLCFLSLGGPSVFAADDAACMAMLQEFTNQMSTPSGVPSMCAKLNTAQSICGAGMWSSVGGTYAQLCELRRQMARDSGTPTTPQRSTAQSPSPNRSSTAGTSQSTPQAAAPQTYVDSSGTACISAKRSSENLELGGGQKVVVLYTFEFKNGCSYDIQLDAVPQTGDYPSPARVPAGGSTDVKCTDNSVAQKDCHGWKSYREVHKFGG